MQVAPGLVGPAGLRPAHRDELAPFQSTKLHRAPASQDRVMQDTELAKISQAGMSDISQRASWRTAKPKTAVGSAIVARVARPIIIAGSGEAACLEDRGVLNLIRDRGCL